jgi:hypothetical protein
MDEYTPLTPEFEKKMQAAASAPAPDPQFVSRLRAQMSAGQPPEISQPHNHPMNLPAQPAWKKPAMWVPAMAAVVLVAVVAFFAFKPATPVSAQQILERATAAQSAQAASQGIQHSQMEIIENHQALQGGGTLTVVEDYFDPARGFSRRIERDATGKMVDIFASDAVYSYSSYSPATAGVPQNGGIVTVWRTPLDPRKIKASSALGPDTQNNLLFEQFRNNPRVRLEGVETWTDGSRVYVLIDDNYQTQKQSDGQVEQTFTGTVRMVFNTKTYQLVESQISVRKDGQDIVIDSVKYPVNEVLPAGSAVAWDLSDLKGITIVDQPAVKQESADPGFKTLTIQELTAHTQTAYLLKNNPEGFTLQIVAVSDQPKDQPFSYETNYTGPNGETFDLQTIGLTDEGFIKSNFYDGSYKSASGLVVYYSTSSDKDSTSAILTTPEGNSFLLESSLPREQVQTLVDDLAPAK